MIILFSLSSFLILPFWFLMIVLPYWKWTQRILQSPLVIVPIALLYPILVLPRLGTVFVAVASPSIASLSGLLSSPVGVTIAWIHFLAFDLFVGRWVHLDSRKRGINAWLMAPILFLTLMLGPIGFLLFLCVRSVPGLSSKKYNQKRSQIVESSVSLQQ